MIYLSDELIKESIKIAKNNKDNFGCSLLKLKLHVCVHVANEILNELVNRGIIEIIHEPKYKINVLV